MDIGEVFEFGEFRMDPLDRSLRRQDHPVALQRRAFDVLLYLVRHPGRVVSKDELLKNVWPDAFVDENNLSQSISVLRKALGDHPGDNTYITTLPGRGYQFVAVVKVVEREWTAHTPGVSLAQPPGTGGLFLHQRTITRTSVTTREDRETKRAEGRLLRAGMVIVPVILLASVGGYLLGRRPHSNATSVSVVAANFLNSTGDATFDHTLDRALEIDLGQSPYMQVMSEGEVVSVLHYMGRPGDTALSADLARQVCLRSNRQAWLTGAISGMGRKYLLTLEATDCASGKEIAAAKAMASSKEDVLAALDSVADHVRSKLGESSKSLQSYQVPIVQATTPSLEALQAYSVGNYLVAHGKDENESLPFFQKAVALDPQFAMAYGQMASDYYNLSQFHQASIYFAKAFQLSEHVSEREKLILQAHYYAEGQHDLENGIKTYTLWADVYPFDSTPLINICNQYTQLGEYGPAIDAGERALKLQTDRSITYSVLARALLRAGRFSEAQAVGDRAINLGKDSVGLHETLFRIAVHERDSTGLARETRWAAAHNAGWYGWFFPYIQAEAKAMSGHVREAQTLYQAAYEKARELRDAESADALLLEEARMEFDSGMKSVARSTLLRVENQNPDVPDLAVLSAELGDVNPAHRFIAAYSHQAGDTQMTGIYLPKVRAAVALAQGKPSDAVTALEPARHYQLVDLSIPTQRAAAYLLARDGAKSSAEYQTVLANSGMEADGHLYPMAHLGLARAFALTGRIDASRSEYRSFLSAWKDADADLPVVKQARAELARL